MDFDVVVVGSGAAGLTTALVAANLGLQVLVLESTPWFGGTTATSGGGAWIPLNHHMKEVGISDSRGEAETYLRVVLGDFFDQAKVGAFLDNAAPMIEFMERHTDLRMLGTDYPDYEPGKNGWKCGRLILTMDFDARLLGTQRAVLRPPRRDTMLFHSMQISMIDPAMLKEALSSWPALKYTIKLVGKYVLDRLRYGRGMRIVNGNALIARLLLSAIRANITLWNNAPATDLILSGAAVTGVVATKEGTVHRIHARKGVVLASGGFGANPRMREKYIPHAAHGFNLQAEGNKGEGIKLGIKAGGVFNDENVANGIWQPLSPFRRADGRWDAAIYTPGRLSPGCIVIDAATGKRFVNEGTNYHRFVRAMHSKGITKGWMISDGPAARKYGIGLANPWPMPIGPWVRNGHVIAADTVADLALKLAVDPKTLTETIACFNDDAQSGQDPEFHRGEDAYSRYNGDHGHQPNPSLGPICTAPFYAVEFRPGETSTLAGLNTNAEAQVLDRDGVPIRGLYAAGADNNNVMRGEYPGGGTSIGTAMTCGYIAARRLAGE